MKAHDPALDSAILALVIGAADPAYPWQDNPPPPVKGRFEKGVGTFYADDTLRGAPIRVRFVWACSVDGGKTWETNWTTDFEPMP